VAAESQEAGNMTHMGSTDNKRKNALYSRRELIEVALRYMAIGIQNELMIRRIQFIKRSKEVGTQVACAGNLIIEQLLYSSSTSELLTIYANYNYYRSRYSQINASEKRIT